VRNTSAAVRAYDAALAVRPDDPGALAQRLSACLRTLFTSAFLFAFFSYLQHFLCQWDAYKTTLASIVARATADLTADRQPSLQVCLFAGGLPAAAVRSFLQVVQALLYPVRPSLLRRLTSALARSTALAARRLLSAGDSGAFCPGCFALSCVLCAFNDTDCVRLLASAPVPVRWVSCAHQERVSDEFALSRPLAPDGFGL
jgi:hypothetical protein